MSPMLGPLLSEMELDALTELVNLGISRSAASLRGMVGQQILLSVPSVRLVTAEDAIRLLSTTSSRLVAVQQLFEGAITGRAMLIFPETSSLELVRTVVGRAMPLHDIVELEQEALAETGNVVLNGCLAMIANTLERRLWISLPTVVQGEASEFFQVGRRTPVGEVVLFLSAEFTVHDRQIQGNIAIVMDLPSLHVLKVLLAAFIQRATGQPSPAC
jgi:chemotaxis protein CheC